MSDVIYQNLRTRFTVKIRADLQNPKRRQGHPPKFDTIDVDQRHPRGERGDEPPSLIVKFGSTRRKQGRLNRKGK